MIPAISSGGRMAGLVSYLAGPGRSNEHTNPHVVAASSPTIFVAGGAGEQMGRAESFALADVLDEARVVFGTEVTRRDNAALNAARERGLVGRAALAEATTDANVWHCSLSLPPDAEALDEATWSAIAHDFMEGMGFDSGEHAAARWVAIHHGPTKRGGDHIHIAASRVRDDGTVIDIYRDFPRSQKVCRGLEAKYGLEVLSGRDRGVPSRGTAHAQAEHAARKGLEEAPSDTLARLVRAAGAAAETEAEFVRLLRAEGLIVKPAHYDTEDREAVTGFSVGLPADRYANRHGRPVMHGGKKLGEDLSLPRLRERWIDDPGTRLDARAAWDHAAGKSVPAQSQSTTSDAPEAGRGPALSTAEIGRRLRAIMVPIARTAATEADYVGRLVDQPEILVRPRYAEGSTTAVTGYSVALHPSIAADDNGRPIWRQPSYLKAGLGLNELRHRWPSSPMHQQMTAVAWQRTSRTNGPAPSIGHGSSARYAEEQARRWEGRLNSIPDRKNPEWAAAAGDTAAILGAAATRMSGPESDSLRHLSDALAASAGRRRQTRPAGVAGATAARRVAAVMLAAQRGNSAMLWLAVVRSVLAASRAVSQSMAEQGHQRQALAITNAVHGVQQHWPESPATAAARESRAPVRPGPRTSSTGLER